MTLTPDNLKRQKHLERLKLQRLYKAQKPSTQGFNGTYEQFIERYKEAEIKAELEQTKEHILEDTPF